MKIIKSRTFDQYELDDNVIAIGSFDGIHKGHKKILKDTLDIAKEKNLKSGVLTFEPHPDEVIGDGKNHLYLSSKSQKIKRLNQLGFDYYFEMEFSHDISLTPFDEFIKKIILDNLNTKHIVVGTDFSLGYQGNGNIDKLKKMSQEYNFALTSIKPLKIGDHKISSSVIRDLIKAGRLQELKKHLDQNFVIEGEVVKGFGRGKKLGIPTANIKPIIRYVLPPDGDYAVYLYIEDDKITIEVHLPNFKGDLYGGFVYLEMIEFLRGEKKFDDVDQLIAAINKDILYILEVL